MNFLKDLFLAIYQGILSGFSDLVYWSKKPRQNPPEEEDTSWHKYYKYPSWRKFAIKESTAQIFVVLVLLIIIRESIGEFRFIPSESMEPTLIVGDKLFIEKFSKRFQPEFKRGDIVVFYPPAAATNGVEVLKSDPFSIFSRLTGLPFLPQPEAYIKRVIGLPEETICVKANQGVFINGVLVQEPYHEGSMKYLPEYDLPCSQIPAGHYFVLGDNRNYSYDSHVWGPLGRDRIIGRAASLIFRGLDEKPQLLLNE